MVWLIAAARFKHDGRWLQMRDRFEASERDAADLCAIRFAYPAPPDDPEVRGRYAREDLKAEDEPRKSKKRRYKRRDMRAEE